MSMLSKSPGRALVLGLALGLACTPGNERAVHEIKDDVASSCLSSIVNSDTALDYQVHDNCRVVVAKGNNLDDLHTVVSREFLDRVGTELRSPGARFTLAGFKTKVEHVDGEYVFSYSVRLNPAKNDAEVHTLVAMRGTVWDGVNAEREVLERNAAKIRPWQDRMQAGYSDMEVDFEVARSSVGNGQGKIFHEAVLAKGAKR